MPDLHRLSLRFLLIEEFTVAAIDLECILEDMGHEVTAVAFGARSAEKILDRYGGEIDAAILEADEIGRGTLSIARSLRSRGIPLVIASDLPGEAVRGLGFIEPHVRRPLSAEVLAPVLTGLRGASLAVAC